MFAIHFPQQLRPLAFPRQCQGSDFFTCSTCVLSSVGGFFFFFPGSSHPSRCDVIRAQLNPSSMVHSILRAKLCPSHFTTEASLLLPVPFPGLGPSPKPPPCSQGPTDSYHSPPAPHSLPPQPWRGCPCTKPLVLTTCHPTFPHPPDSVHCPPPLHQTPHTPCASLQLGFTPNVFRQESIAANLPLRPCAKHSRVFFKC